jgi:superfamily I DNA and RNA helicase
VANSLFFNQVQENDNNRDIIRALEQYALNNPTEQLYLITAPLSEQKYNYEYEDNALVILSPKHKIIFLDLANNEDKFEEYCEDFIEDLSSLSDKYNYKQHIGRPRKWKSELIYYEENIPSDINKFLSRHTITDSNLKRKVELLISLLIGSINDIKKVGVDTPETLLEKVKKNIILFDGDQTRFIYKDFRKKTVSIQGLSGTGKTELLLHKLKELYIKDDYTKIFFTCHNKTLAKNLKDRIPKFFDFMKVEKQIEWNKRLWVSIAWGSEKYPNTGIYSYICDFYNIPFMRYRYGIGYKEIFSEAVKYIDSIKNNDDFDYAFDYILIDERQDFPKEFFELCEKVTKKQVYIAGDIFQDIWDNTGDDELEVDIVLNRCYRTDPRTLMFAHALGMGLFEDKKLNWLSDTQWEEIGYFIERKKNRQMCLSREPIRRFEDLEQEDMPSMIIEKQTSISQIVDLLKKIKDENPTVEPDDIAIIIVDDNSNIYEFIDKLGYKISENLGWEINRAYDTKTKIENTIFISNRNNVKGLEFPFVICITGKIKNGYKYRNSLYTMLTRSFIQSYLLVRNDDGIDVQQKGLDIINSKKCIQTEEPTEEEKETIRQTVIKMKEEKNISYDEFLNKIFDDLKIPQNCRKKLKKGLIDFEIEEFNEGQTIHYIEQNKNFCK